MNVSVRHVDYFTSYAPKDASLKIRRFKQLAKENTFEVKDEKELKMHIQRLTGCAVKKIRYKEVDPE